LCLPGAPQSARNAETGASVDLGALKVPRRDFALIFGITVRLLPFDQPISWSIAPGMKILIKCDFF
jgi:hypothetical protein